MKFFESMKLVCKEQLRLERISGNYLVQSLLKQDQLQLVVQAHVHLWF